MKLDEKVVAWLARQDGEIYLVGGCVRDRLLGRPVCDLDITVNGDGISLARRLADHFGGAYFPLDLNRSAGRALLRDQHDQRLVVDVARFRGLNLEEDLAGRDFTINALASTARAPTDVIDRHGGLADLDAGRIHPVSASSIRDDPLRALRAVRQALELGFALTPETERLIRRDGHLLASVSGERIRDEMSRLLATPDAATQLSYLDNLGVLTTVIPELEPLRNLSQPQPHHLDVLAHSLTTVRVLEDLIAGWLVAHAVDGPGEGPVPDARLGIADDGTSRVLGHFASRLVKHLLHIAGGDRSRLVTLKLAALLHDSGKLEARTVDEDGRIRFLRHANVGAEIIARVMHRLRFSNAEIRLAETIVRHHMRPLLLAAQKRVSPRAVYRFFRDTGDAGVDILLLTLADHKATVAPDAEDPRWPRLERLAVRMLTDFWERPRQRVTPPPIIDGNDLLKELDLQPGPRIGDLLELVREAQVCGRVSTRDEALSLLRAILEETPPVENRQGDDEDKL